MSTLNESFKELSVLMNTLPTFYSSPRHYTVQDTWLDTITTNVLAMIFFVSRLSPNLADKNNKQDHRDISFVLCLGTALSLSSRGPSKAPSFTCVDFESNSEVQTHSFNVLPAHEVALPNLRKIKALEYMWTLNVREDYDIP